MRRLKSLQNITFHCVLLEIQYVPFCPYTFDLKRTKQGPLVLCFYDLRVEKCLIPPSYLQQSQCKQHKIGRAHV